MIDRTLAEAQEFFHSPVEEKRRVAIKPVIAAGTRWATRSMYEAKRPDYKEFYSIGLELPDSDPDVRAGEELRGPNNWPDCLPELPRRALGYYDAMRPVRQNLLRCVAVSLGRSGFSRPATPSRCSARRSSTIRRSRPSPMRISSASRRTPISAASPCSGRTTTAGCEVLERSSGTWIRARRSRARWSSTSATCSGRWTNDRYASTPHRVLNRSRARALLDRDLP